MVRDATVAVAVKIGESKSQIKALKDEIRGLNSEYRVTSEEMKYTGTESEKLTEKHRLLAAQLEKQQAITKLNSGLLQKYTDNQVKSAERLQQAQEALKQAKASGNAEEIEKSQKAVDSHTKSIASLQSNINKYTKDLERSKSAEEVFAAELRNVNVELSSHSGALQDISGKMKLFAENYERGARSVENVASSMKNIGAGMTVGITAPVLAAGTAASKAAIDFESAFTGVTKTVDGTQEQISALKQGIRDMAKEIPVSANEIAGVAEAAGQLGIETENVLKFTRIMSDLGVSTNMTAESAATSLAKFANNTRMSRDDFDKLGSTIVKLGNDFATTESEIVEMSLRLAGAGTQIGISQSQILGISAALSAMGITAEMGGTAFSKTMTSMQLAVENGAGKALEVIDGIGLGLEGLNRIAETDSEGFKKLAADIGLTSNELKGYLNDVQGLNDFARVAGMSAGQFAQAFKTDAAGAISAFISGLSQMNESGISSIKILNELGISEAGLRDTLLRASNASGLFSDALEKSNQAWQENTALTEEASKRYETAESKLQVMKNRLADVAIEMGSAFLPAIVSIAEKLGGLADKFGELDEDTQKLIVTIVAIAAAAGPVIGTAGKAAEIIAGLKSALALLSVQAATAGAATAAAGTSAAAAAGGFTALNIAMGPVGIVVAALTVALGVGAAAWSKYSNELKEAETAIIKTGDSLEQAGKKYDEAMSKVSGVEKLIDEWESLKTQIDSNTLSVKELAEAELELGNVQQKLIENSNGVISRYDVENDKVKERIDLLKQHLAVEAELSKADLSVQVDRTDIDVLKSRNQQYKDTIEDLNSQKLELANVRQALSDLVREDSLVRPSDRTPEYLFEYHKKVSEIYETVAGIKGITAPMFELSDATELIDEMFDKTSESLEEMKSKFYSTSKGISEYYNQSKRLIEVELGSVFEDEVKKLALLNRALDESKAKTGTAAGTKKALASVDAELARELEKAADKTALLSKAQAESQHRVDAFKEKLGELAAQVGELPDGKTIDVEVLITDITEAVNRNIEAENRLVEATGTAAESSFNAAQSAYEEALAREALTNAIDETTYSVNRLENAYRTLSEGGRVSVDVLTELIEKYPLVAEYIAKTGDVTLSHGEIIKTIAKLEREALLEKMDLRAKDLENEIQMAEKRVEAVRREYNDKVRLAQIYAGVTPVVNDGRDKREIDTALAEIQRKKDELTRIQAQINAINNTVSATEWFSGSQPASKSSSSGSAVGKAQKEAEATTKAELDEWIAYYKERESESKKWIDKQKFYGEMSYQEEVLACERVLDYLKGYREQVKSLTFATGEEKLKIINDINDKIESYERQRYTAGQKINAESLKEWSAYWKEREETSSKWIDKEKFYNQLSPDEEISAYERVLSYLNEAKAEAARLTFATEDEKAKLIKGFSEQIEGYERKRYTAEKNLKQESLQDTMDAESKKEAALRKSISEAETAAQKLQAYEALRTELTRRLNISLSLIDEKYWLSERERLKEYEAVYEEHTRKIEDIDKNSHEIRKQQNLEYAEQWYKAERRKLEDSYKEKRTALDKELQAVRDYYSALDAEENRADREKQLGELYYEASIYQGAATREGQEKYKSIISQIERLEKEAAREARQEEQRQKEAQITERIDELDIDYEKQQASLDKRYEYMKDAGSKLARFTADEMESAAEQVTNGLTGLFEAYSNELDEFSSDALNKVKKLASDVVDVFRSIDYRFGQSSSLNGAVQNNVVNNSRRSNVTLNDYGDKIFSSASETQLYLDELSSLLLYAHSQHV